MKEPGAGAWRSLSLVLAAGLVTASVGLVWLGYRATREWQRSTLLLMERRTEVMLALASTALNRDMKGAQVSVLLPIRSEDLTADPPYDLRDGFRRAFARFPYPESFFVWQSGAAPQGRTWVFHRSERPPPWHARQGAPGPYPVVMLRDPEALRDLVVAARRYAREGWRFAVFQEAVAGTPYQVIVQSFPRRPRDERGDLVGFTVNLTWAREHYFHDLLREVARIGGDEESVSLVVLDEGGRAVARTGPIREGVPARERRFPVLFFDPAMRSVLATGLPPPAQWTLRAGAADDRVLAAASRGARRTFVLLALAAGATVVGMLLTARAVRVRAELAALRSDFVSTVTHELKTPLALIRLVGDTLHMGRYSSAETIRDYARLLSQEAQRLTRLIDNLLTYSRVSEPGGAYSFEALDVAELVEDALVRVRPRLAEMGFRVTVGVPLDLPRVRGDRTALLQVFDNLLDNAVKYSAERRCLSIDGRSDGPWVRLEVADCGQGIPPEETSRVFERFYRGRGARGGGSGLGLAIVLRIVNDHGGRAGVRGRPGGGTVVSLDLPVAAA